MLFLLTRKENKNNLLLPMKASHYSSENTTLGCEFSVEDVMGGTRRGLSYLLRIKCGIRPHHLEFVVENGLSYIKMNVFHSLWGGLVYLRNPYRLELHPP